jgi:CubicO group peptidase (beta-lactamase class C family)
MRRLLAGALILAAGLILQVAPLSVSAAPFSRVQGDTTGLGDLDEFITSVMEEWKVPGLAIAVAKDGEVVFSEGFGYRDVDEELPVTSRTLFAIGSISKSFTVTVLGMLEDEGLLDWDEPVRTYLPDFRLHDEVASERMTPRDLVTHRSGLPRHDGLWYGSDLTRREMYERLRYLEPNRDFRAVFQYQNLMFMTAGYLAGQLAGKTWEGLVRARIFEPLGMSRSNFSVDESQRSDDFAYPYVKVEEDVRQVDFRNLDEIGPAGSINSSVAEMIRYVQFHIDQGTHGDEQLLSEGNAAQMQTPQMVIPGGIEYDELGHTSYGMGFFVTTYRGHKLVHHGGGIDGFISLLSFMPRERLGMIVLTNLSGNNPVPTIVTRGVYDRLLGLEPVDWAGRVKEAQAKAEEAEEEGEGEERGLRVEGTSPSHALADFAGTYEHPGYGRITVESDGDQLEGTFNGVSSVLEHFHYDVFQAREDPLNPFSGAKVMFLYNKKGAVDRLLVPLEPNVDDIIFTRVPDESMRERAFLEPFTGEYELGGTVLTVSLKGDDTLVLTGPGQPSYELVPTRGTSFDLKTLTGYSLEFRQDESGAVTELVLYQPNGTFVAKRR